MLLFIFLGGRTKDQIIQWLNKKSGPAAKLLSSEEEQKEFINSQDVVIIGYFENAESEGAKLFNDIADAVDEHQFGIVSDYSKFSNVEHKEKLVLYKNVS